MQLSAATALTLALSVTMAGCGCKNGGRCAEPPSESGLDNTALLGRPSPLSATVIASEGDTTRFRLQVQDEEITLKTGYTGDVFAPGQMINIDHGPYGLNEHPDSFVTISDTVPSNNPETLFQSTGNAIGLSSSGSTIQVEGTSLDCCPVGADCNLGEPRGLKFKGGFVGDVGEVILASGEEGTIMSLGHRYRVSNRRAKMTLASPRSCQDSLSVYNFAVYRLRATP